MLNGCVADRTVIRLGGDDARGFLQDLVSNDMRRAAPDRAVYAALLTPQGKFISDFLALAEGGAEDALWLDVATAHARPLAQRLGLYRLRRKVTITAAPVGVAVLWGAPPSALDAAPGAPASEGAPEGAPEGARIVADPRHADLGHRLYAADPAAALAALGVRGASAEDFAAHRIALGVPETDADLTPETYILEAGFERLNGVDFRKGCFVGQEIVARMKHKTELRKGLVRVAVEGPAPPPGTEIVTADGKPAGVLGSSAGGLALAHLRFDRADGPLRAGEASLRRMV